METLQCLKSGAVAPECLCLNLASVTSWVNKQKLTFPYSTVQFSSVAQSCPTLCDPINRSTPGLPVHHQLPEFTQTHVHWVGDAIQPSHPVIPFSSCPQSFPASESFQMSQLIWWPKYWSFSLNISPSHEHPVLISFRMDWLDLLAF